MTAIKKNLDPIFRGETKVFRFTFTDKTTLLPIDVTGFSIVMTVKEDIDLLDTEAAFQKSTTVEDALGGILSLEITPEESKAITAQRYRYDFVLTDASGNVTVMQIGTVRVQQPVNNPE